MLQGFKHKWGHRPSVKWSCFDCRTFLGVYICLGCSGIIIELLKKLLCHWRNLSYERQQLASQHHYLHAKHICQAMSSEEGLRRTVHNWTICLAHETQKKASLISTAILIGPEIIQNIYCSNLTMGFCFSHPPGPMYWTSTPRDDSLKWEYRSLRDQERSTVVEARIFYRFRSSVTISRAFGNWIPYSMDGRTKGVSQIIKGFCKIPNLIPTANQ